MRARTTSIEKLYIITIAFSLIVLPSIKLFGGKGIAFAEGERTGKVYKFSRKGFLWKTWEGQMSIGLVTQASEGKMVNEVFDFSCSDPAVVEQLKSAQHDGSDVTLSYVQYLFYGARYGSTPYQIVAVKERSLSFSSTQEPQPADGPDGPCSNPSPK